MVVLELETFYAQAAPHTKLLNKRFLGAHHWLGPLKEALVARLAADKVRDIFDVIYFSPNPIFTPQVYSHEEKKTTIDGQYFNQRPHLTLLISGIFSCHIRSWVTNTTSSVLVPQWKRLFRKLRPPLSYPIHFTSTPPKRTENWFLQ